MTVRIDDELASFVDESAQAGEGSRAEIINRALRREVRRRAALQDAGIYVATMDPDLDSDAYAEWAGHNAQRLASDLD